MAFTTEFVMGAGGGYDSLNFYWEDSGGTGGSPKVTTVATVDAGEKAVVKVSGSLIRGASYDTQTPHVQIGDAVFAPTPSEMSNGISTVASGPVEIRCLSRVSQTSSLAGHVSVIKYTPPARYVASGGGEGPVLPPRSEWYTLSQHTVTGSGESLASFEVVRASGLNSGMAAIRVNGNPVARRSGSVSPLTGEGVVVVKPGDVVTLDVFMDSASGVYRQVTSWSWTLS